MKVLVCGARGFIGRHLAQALAGAGHAVVRGVSSHQGAPGDLPVDFRRDVEPAVWRARLVGVDAVVNAVGVLRDSPRRPADPAHREVPMALFSACAEAGVRQVVQVSALGIEGGDTAYARSKRAADEHLLRLVSAARLNATVLRPSVVYGPGGASAALFDTLACSPVLLLPAEVRRCRVQPLHVDDLAAMVAHLLSPGSPVPARIDCVGPRAMSLEAFIACLRRQRGHGPARVVTLPGWVTRWSVALGDAWPVTPWGSQALALLATDNTADAALFGQWLHRAPRDPGSFAC